VDCGAQGNTLDGVDPGCGIGAQIELVQDHHRRGPTLPGCRQVALDTAGAEVIVQTGDQKGIIQIRCDDLFVVALAGRAAREPCCPRQHCLNLRRILVGRALV
jgi:hypothetical protein